MPPRIDDRIQVGRLSLRPEVAEVLQRIAAEEDRPVVTVARRAVGEWVERYERDREAEGAA